MNSVNLIGNLTRDPELRVTPGGTPVCSLRIAVNDRYKDSATGQWTDRPYYFDVTVWGAKGENCAQWLSKGKKVGISGKLTWREWEAQDGSKRQAVDINAFDVEFLTPKQDGEGPRDTSSSSGVNYDHGSYADFSPADDDIPF